MKPHAVRELAPAAVEGCRHLVRIVEMTRSRFDQKLPCADVARGVCADIGLKEDIYHGATSNSAAARRWGNVEGMLQVFARRDAQGKGDRDSFAEFLRILALREEREEEQADRVTLSTMHGAKGLEFRVVFVVGLEDGLMPHRRTLDEHATDATSLPDGGEVGHSLDEERRLFYVAVTRARDKLYLSRCKVRGMRGKAVARTPSRFLDAIGEELLLVREESAPAAPEIAQTQAGVASVLAALSSLPAGEAPLIRRRR
jgi:DNA helicase-2/ATP-dependent DNA helicase PcrA